jgi:flagellar hook-associated protein 2
MADSSPLRLGGIYSGIDTESLIQKILDVSRIPIKLNNQKSDVLSAKNDAITALKKSLVSLQGKLTSLKSSSFFSSSTASTSDATIATATAVTTAAKSRYTIAITDLASASSLKTGTATGDKVAANVDPTALLTSDQGFGSSLTLGTFTVNGSAVTIDATDTLNTALGKISAATGGVVTGVYNAGTDEITLSSAGTIILGGGGDTSTFLSRMRLYTNGTNSVTSLTTLGTIDTSQTVGSAASRIGNAALLTTGDITINGVSVSIDTTVDTLQNILDRITASTAGVYASYDSVEDRLIFTSKSTGSTGITIADGTSNFASNMKLTTATSQLNVGQDTTFTVDGGVPRVSTDNIISETESGITGVTITALQANSTVDITVALDSSTIQKAISDFITQYNSVQSLITSYTATPNDKTEPTDSASILNSDTLITFLSTDLRKNLSQAYSTGTYQSIFDLGIKSSSSDNLLTISDTSKLTTALATDPSDVIAIFTSLTTALDTYLNTQTTTIDKEEKRLENVNAEIERHILEEENRLIASFSALEEYQARAQKITTFLQSQKK